MGKVVTPWSCQPTGCQRCHSPLDITTPENQVRIASPNVAIFQCPECGQLVLDDAVGWKGSGLVAHVTEDDITDYLRTGQLPDQTISAKRRICSS